MENPANFGVNLNSRPYLTAFYEASKKTEVISNEIRYVSLLSDMAFKAFLLYLSLFRSFKRHENW